MIIKNYAPGIVNGTLCKLISFSRDVVHVQLLTGSRKRSVVMLPRCSFQVLPGTLKGQGGAANYLHSYYLISNTFNIIFGAAVRIYTHAISVECGIRGYSA